MILPSAIVLLLMFIIGACRTVSAGSRQDGGRVPQRQEFGAKSDGIADDTVAIQGAVNATKPGDTIYSLPGSTPFRISSLKSPPGYLSRRRVRNR